MKTLIYKNLKREKAKKEVNCLSMMKEEEGVGQDVELPSCRICQFLAPGASARRIATAPLSAAASSKESSFSRG